jgi:hypothetical protein
MNTKITAVVVIVIIIVVAGVSLYYVSAKLSASSTDSTTSSTTVISGNATSVVFVSDSLTVGFQSGLWDVTLKNTGDVGVKMMVVTLETPITSYMCTASFGGSTLSFSNCTPGASPGNPMPAGGLLVGSASGSGEGSATIGSSYTVAAKVTYLNGVVEWSNSTVVAQSPS